MGNYCLFNSLIKSKAGDNVLMKLVTISIVGSMIVSNFFGVGKNIESQKANTFVF